MNRTIKLAVGGVFLTLLACSTVWPAGPGEVWLGNSLVLRVRSAAAGYTIDQRVNALQVRANDLLKAGRDIPSITVRTSGRDAVVYTGDKVFVTVTSADAQANGTTTERLASIWAGRLRTLLPRITMYKPGVGSPTDAPQNAQ
jgi:hypothetical protein